MSKIKDILNPDYNAYGERDLVSDRIRSNNQDSEEQTTINDIIKYNYPKSGLSSIKNFLDYYKNRDTILY